MVYDEEKLFRKNKELIDKAISRLEGSPSGTDSYYRTMKEIHHLEDQLKIAMTSMHSFFVTVRRCRIPLMKR